MAATFATSGAMGGRTIEGRGKGLAGSHANGEGGLSTGIGIGANNSGFPVPGNFTATTVDFLPARIGGGSRSVGASSNSDSNLGNVLSGATVVGGSGYTNGTFLVNTTGGGQPDGTGQLTVVVAAGVITSADVNVVGAGFTTVPTLLLAALGGGTLGSVTLTIGREGAPAAALGVGFGVNKGTRYLLAAGIVAPGGVIATGYLNRSTRIMAAGEGAWAVAA